MNANVLWKMILTRLNNIIHILIEDWISSFINVVQVLPLPSYRIDNTSLSSFWSRYHKIYHTLANEQYL